ncbi:MAG: penicillin-binding protein 2 [Elusimicrobia bacterium]|nr:penicillin-binding protein 2 [Elusimicrobiota bacterium]
MATLSEKAAWLRLLMFSFFAVFGLRLFFLQVVFGRHYRLLAERNRFQIFYRQAPRGTILDRTGYPLASNIGVFNLYFNPNFLVEDAEDRVRVISGILNLKLDDLRRAVKTARVGRKTSLAARQISPEAAFRFFEKQESYPEFFLTSESLRYYPLGEAFAHVVGYLSRIRSRVEFEKLKDQGYRYDSWLGGYGLEKLFEQHLRGCDGAVLIEVDVHGRPLSQSRPAQEASGEKRSQAGVSLVEDSYPGNDMELTIDHRLIMAAHQALKASSSGAGSVVALDPRSGAVRALVSTPGFDPNGYIRLTLEKPEVLLRAEFPRALTGLYPPGSVFKVITAIAALEKGLDPARRFRCMGKFALPGRTFKCWKEEGHGSLDFIEGIRNSCDVYFYNAGLFAGGEAISSWALKFSLGRSITVKEFPEWSKKGFIPTPRWKEEKKKDIWRPGDTLNLAIGQGEVLTSPLQLAALFAMLAGRGRLAQPYIIEALKNPSGGVFWRNKPVLADDFKIPAVSDKTWQLLEAGLRSVVVEGTGRGANIAGYDIYGKTGTAQNPLGKDHALFACYLKDASGTPRLAVSVVVDNGGQGSVAAVPVARRVLEEFIKEEFGG